MSKLENLKENKKVMMIKMEQASKMFNDAVEEFVDFVESLVKDASEEDIKEILDTDDELIEIEDKVAIVAAYSECHENFKGIMVIQKR